MKVSNRQPINIVGDLLQAWARLGSAGKHAIGGFGYCANSYYVSMCEWTAEIKK